jgi:hypothetical protein
LNFFFSAQPSVIFLRVVVDVDGKPVLLSCTNESVALPRQITNPEFLAPPEQQDGLAAAEDGRASRRRLSSSPPLVLREKLGLGENLCFFGYT